MAYLNRTLVAMASATLLCGCASSPPSTSGTGAQLFSGMGRHTRPVTTTDRLAQRYFDQALTWTYAFNHDEAIRSYSEVAALDPDCAMAWWGVALCHGPHINNPVMPEERRAAAWEALQKARSLEAKASPVERDLIRALSKRYSADFGADREPMDRAYAEAMLGVWAAHPEDADVGTLTAEALMDLQPWDLWTRAGEAKGRTREIVAILERVMELDPGHPGALHLYIHAMEASPEAHKAVPAADRLRRLVPTAGHLVHMPAHIDVRVGRWDQASDSNVRAARADAAYRRKSPNQGFYHLYMAHNHHFLAYSAMMEGRYETALDAARDMLAGIPPEFLETSAAVADAYTSIEFQVLTRFGKWDEVLAVPEPPGVLPITRAMWRFARGTALAAKGDLAGARKEQEALRVATLEVPEEAMTAINVAHDVLAIAELVLEGEIAFREGDISKADTLLRDAAHREDNLVYMEPPEWIQPVRHSLGAILLVSGRAAEAAEVYREDLERWPENGWALHGLASALRATGATAEAAEVETRFRKAWRRADTVIEASCLCVLDRTASR